MDVELGEVNKSNEQNVKRAKSIANPLLQQSAEPTQASKALTAG